MSADKSQSCKSPAFLGDGCGRGAAAMSSPAMAQSRDDAGNGNDGDGSAGRTLSCGAISPAFGPLNWQDYFANTRNGVILVDTTSR